MKYQKKFQILLKQTEMKDLSKDVIITTKELIILDWSILWKVLCIVERWFCCQNGSLYENYMYKIQVRFCF